MAITIVGVLMLVVVCVAVVLTLRAWSVWREGGSAIWRQGWLLFVVGLAWTFVLCAGYLTPRNWRTTDAGLTRIAEQTAAAGIWVTPNLVVWDYNTRQSGDEFYTLMQRPAMRYLRPGVRDLWINHNRFRKVPDAVSPIQSLVRRSYGKVMSRLVKALHEANVPLLAGSDAVAPPGVLPGFSLHEELSLLVQAGLTPYEALRTATVNAASYLDADQEFGKVAAGFSADLVLLEGNPLEDISYTLTRVGVMKAGRWFSGDELDTALARLAEARK